MTLLLSLLGAITVLELTIWMPGLWQIRKFIACAAILGLSVVSGLLFGQHFQFWAGILLILSAYRIVNLLRILEDRLQPKQLVEVTRRTSVWLITSQIVVFLITILSNKLAITSNTWLYVIVLLQLAAALVLFLSAVRHLRTTQSQVPSQVPAQNLPTLSVLVPARNETSDLEACLSSLISSDYPKLEIIVLDDCSQNKRTPGIIKDFAQSGVRFIAGKTPSKAWLAKNYAYEQLTEEANGELLLFCGVDTRFSPHSLRAIVETMLAKDKQMISLIPKNTRPGMNLEAVFIQPARYAWELAIPRRWRGRTPVLSTCWIISAAQLQAAGSFSAVSNSVSPEAYFARYSAHHGDNYSFLQSNDAIGLTSDKPLSEQRATAVRTRYPQLHRRPELVALTLLTEVGTLTLPFAALALSIIRGAWPAVVISAVTCILLTILYASIVRLTYREFLWRGVWTVPFAPLYDISLLNYSMWQYEFREVIWKGRNVCIPVMQSTPVLPRQTVSN
ncbi:MAG TPA: glycosyltransferase [Candidatus Saccharimonadales bacterium]|nr:glycosyltransferase [Candidatus Saccharimonadales bacterium]